MPQLSERVKELNELLRRELGSAPINVAEIAAGGPISQAGSPAPNLMGTFMWEWSEDLFWPAYRTGRNVKEKRSYAVPIMDGSGGEEQVECDVVVPEYKRDRMTKKYNNQWLITCWTRVETLAGWESQFPGAKYPLGGGYRIHTNFANDPGKEPTYEDTICFIRAVKDQRRAEWHQAADAAEIKALLSRRSEGRDLIGDAIPAFLNPNPGKRGGSVSFGGYSEERASHGKQLSTRRP